MTTTHDTEVVTRVTARDRFRAVPTTHSASAPEYVLNTGVPPTERLCAYVDSYDEAHENGMRMLAKFEQVESFRVEKITARYEERGSVIPQDNNVVSMRPAYHEYHAGRTPS